MIQHEGMHARPSTHVCAWCKGQVVARGCGKAGRTVGYISNIVVLKLGISDTGYSGREDKAGRDTVCGEMGLSLCHFWKLQYHLNSAGLNWPSRQENCKPLHSNGVVRVTVAMHTVLW